MMDFEDQHEVEEEEEEMEEEEEDDDEDDGPDLLSTNCDSSHPNCSSRQFKMPIEARSQSPPPLPLSLSFPAGKRPSGPARYRECLKNHAVGLGGHAVDGCCEFMPAGPGGTLDALKCAACSCHRNFHRKEADPAGAQLQIQAPAAYYAHPQHPGAPRPIFQFYPYGRPGPGGYHQQRPVAMALPSTSGGVRLGGGGEAEVVSAPAAGMELGKRRHRTKFTAEQKEKMLELAEKLGWRLQKQDEPLIQHFCDVSGVKRHVLKVWMHNNKHTLGKRNPS